MLSVRNLSVRLHRDTILDNVSFDVPAGGTLCVVGESGSGKTSLLRALHGLLPAHFESLTFVPPDAEALRFRGSRRGTVGLPGSRWVMQDPMAALNPRKTLGASIAESLSPDGRADVDQAVHSALLEAELGHAFSRRLPGEVSLGQAQRACLARALIARPGLIFFDEPLTALDAVVQKQIARTMRRIQLRHGMAYVIVTHDLGFAATYADRILALRAGRVEASQPAPQFFQAPASAYCRDLVSAARILGSLTEDTAAVHRSGRAVG